ncbi:5920_t:CDS:10, partial [Ambispora gerdemannii]
MSTFLSSGHTDEEIIELTNENIIESGGSSSNIIRFKDTLINISQSSFEYGSVIKKPRQFRALSRLTLTLTVRNWKTNFCCIFLTPLLMMIIMQFIVIAVYPSVHKGDEDKPQVIYCSNNSKYMNYGNVPNLKQKYDEYGVFTNRTRSSPALVEDVIRPLILMRDNYFTEDANNTGYRSCSNLFTGNQSSYTKNPSPYFDSTDYYDQETKDTTYLPKPDNGWWENIEKFNNSHHLLYNHVPQTFPFGYIVAENEIDELSERANDPTTSMAYILEQLTTCIKNSVNSNSRTDIENNLNECLKNSAGRKDQGPFLNNIPHKYLNLPFSLLRISPKFQEIDHTKFSNVSIDTGAFSGSNKSSVNQNLFKDFNDTFISFKKFVLAPNSSNVRFINPLPHGAILFDKLDSQNGIVSYTLQYGSIPKIWSIVLRNVNKFIYNKNGVYEVLIRDNNFGTLLNLLLDYPSAGFRRLIASTKEYVEIVAKLQAMPRKFDIKELDPDLTALIGWAFYPYAISFLMPIFVMVLVREKEERVFIIMKMSGLSTFKHTLGHYLEFAIMQTISCLVFYLTGFVLEFTIFTRTDPCIILLYFLIWINIQVAMGFLFSVFFSKTRRALVTVYVFVVLSAIISGTTVFIFGNYRPPRLWYINPSFALYEGLRYITRRASLDDGFRPYDIGHLDTSDELLVIMNFLVFEWIFMMLLTFYFQAILPTKYGVPKSYLFFITEPYNWIKNYFSDEKISKSNDSKLYQTSAIQGLGESEHENFNDSERERQRILNGEVNPLNCNFVVKELVKVYRNKKLAVDRLSFSAEENLIFGLLGPNGAGKSSAIHVMTGLYPPTAGTAYIAGYDIRTDMAKVYTEIGVCPQHDLLWSDLTIEEHLLFYARLRGVDPKKERQAVEHALEQVELTELKTRLTKNLSGGEKRRLSIAIALTGDSKVLFLDEPTTGLDPDVRRTIWRIVSKAKKNKSIILTTHSMEEADALCDRIGIVSAGQLRCLGSPLYLKTTYGSGFKLHINSSRLNSAFYQIEKYITPPFTIINKFATSATYQFNAARGVISTLFKVLEARKIEWGIVDYSINQSTLEDVFL